MLQLTPPHWINANTLTVEGHAAGTGATFWSRLPAQAADSVPASVWNTARFSSGITVEFQTSARHVKFSWVASDKPMVHPRMPTGAVNGFDLYVRHPGSVWRYHSSFRSRSTSAQLTLTMERGLRDYRLHLPLANGTISLQLASADGPALLPLPPRPVERRRPVVACGGSVTLGDCVSRPGMTWVAKLGREIDRPVRNFGFPGNGGFDPGVAAWAAAVDPFAVVADFLSEPGAGNAADLENQLITWIQRFRAIRPTTPILVLGQPRPVAGTGPTTATQRFEGAVDWLRRQGVPGLVTVPGIVWDSANGEGSVDGFRLNDIGMMQTAELLSDALRQIS